MGTLASTDIYAEVTFCNSIERRRRNKCEYSKYSKTIGEVYLQELVKIARNVKVGRSLDTKAGITLHIWDKQEQIINSKIIIKL